MVLSPNSGSVLLTQDINNHEHGETYPASSTSVNLHQSNVSDNRTGRDQHIDNITENNATDTQNELNIQVISPQTNQTFIQSESTVTPWVSSVPTLNKINIQGIGVDFICVRLKAVLACATSKLSKHLNTNKIAHFCIHLHHKSFLLCN